MLPFDLPGLAPAQPRERNARIAVTVAQRARLVVALGIVNLVLAAVALGIGTVVETTSPTVARPENLATLPSPSPGSSASPTLKPPPTIVPQIAVVPTSTSTPSPTPAPAAEPADSTRAVAPRSTPAQAVEPDPTPDLSSTPPAVPTPRATPAPTPDLKPRQTPMPTPTPIPPAPPTPTPIPPATAPAETGDHPPCPTEGGPPPGHNKGAEPQSRPCDDGHGLNGDHGTGEDHVVGGVLAGSDHGPGTDHGRGGVVVFVPLSLLGSVLGRPRLPEPSLRRRNRLRSGGRAR